MGNFNLDLPLAKDLRTATELLAQNVDCVCVPKTINSVNRLIAFNSFIKLTVENCAEIVSGSERERESECVWADGKQID